MKSSPTRVRHAFALAALGSSEVPNPINKTALKNFFMKGHERSMGKANYPQIKVEE